MIYRILNNKMNRDQLITEILKIDGKLFAIYGEDFVLDFSKKLTKQKLSIKTDNELVILLRQIKHYYEVTQFKSPRPEPETIEIEAEQAEEAEESQNVN